MNYIVTGGLGFIGSHLCEMLVQSGHSVVIVDDARASSVAEVQGAELLHMPLRDLIADQVPEGAVLMHLASPVGPVGVLGHAGRIVPEAVGDAEHLRGLALQKRNRLVYVSTSEIYGEQRQPMNESASRIIKAGASARMEYAVAKLASETMLLNTDNLDVRVVRPFNVAGARQQASKGFVLPRFVEQALAHAPLTLYQPGTQRRAFTHVRDIAYGIMLAAERGKPGAVYNLGNPDNERTMRELAERVIERAASQSIIEVLDPQVLWGRSFRDAPDKIPDITLAKRELGWTPKANVDAIIDDVIEEHSARSRA